MLGGSEAAALAAGAGSSSCIATASSTTTCRRWTTTTCAGASRRCTRPMTRRPRSWSATPSRRWLSRSWPTRPGSRMRGSAPTWCSGWPAPQASAAWSAASSSTSLLRGGSVRPTWTGHTLRMQAMKTARDPGLLGGSRRDRRRRPTRDSARRCCATVGAGPGVPDCRRHPGPEASPEAMGKATGKDKDAARPRWSTVSASTVPGRMRPPRRRLRGCRRTLGRGRAHPSRCRPIHGCPQDLRPCIGDGGSRSRILTAQATPDRDN